jgi:hypothetical protein
MQLGNFNVSIPEGRDQCNGYVTMMHEQCYRIQMTNYDYQRRCDAEVFVDGKSVGTFRILKTQTITLERPANDTGKFTFYKAGTSAAQQAGEGNVGVNQRGLVEVVFKPEKYVAPPPPPVGTPTTRRGQHSNCSKGSIGTRGLEPTTTDFCENEGVNNWENEGGALEKSYGSGAERSLSYTSNVSPGITGLSGTSNQTFYNVANLDYDPSLETKISLRLVHDDERAGPRELKPANCTVVPAPV